MSGPERSTPVIVEHVSGRQRRLIFDDLEVERSRHDALRLGVLPEFGKRVFDGARALQGAERMRDRQRGVAQLPQARLEGRPERLSRLRPIGGPRGEAQGIT